MSTAAGTPGESRIFLRKASGLIRTAGTFDTFVYNIGLVSVGLGLVTMLYYGPAFYPGGDLVIGSILAGIMMACIAFGMICWSVTLPRSCPSPSQQTRCPVFSARDCSDVTAALLQTVRVRLDSSATRSNCSASLLIR